MNRNELVSFTRNVVLAVLAVCVAFPATAQSPDSLDVLIQGLASPDVKTRVDSFSVLFSRGFTTPYQAMRNLLRAHPAEAERIKIGMITALEMAQPYLQELRMKNDHFDEAFSEYYADLIGAVAFLRDPRALKSLLGAIDTGGMAVDGLADLGPAAVDAIIEKSHDGDHQIRTSAMSALGECLRRVEMLRSSPEIVVKARRATLAALNDPEPWVRSAALGPASLLLDDPEISAKVKTVASADPEPGLASVGPRSFPVRAAATGVLNLKADEMFYVMRAPESRECRVQQATEPPVGVRYLGPNISGPVATHMMCTHYDDSRKDPSLCWSIQPANVCGP